MNGDVKLSIDRYLAECSQIEETVGATYRHWSLAPEYDVALKELWQQMETEERDHVCQIELLRRLARGADIGTSSLSDEKVFEMLDFARNCLTKITMSRFLVNEALALAIQLEGQFRDFHASQAVVCSDAELGKLFTNLSRNDADHAQRLKTVYRENFFDQASVSESLS